MLLHVVGQSLKQVEAACKRAQQLPALLLRACCQWSANGCNNSQQVWDPQCTVERIQPISLCNPCVMSVRGTQNVGKAVQTDPTLLRYTSAITEQKKCWELLAEKLSNFAQQHATTSNNMQQGVQTDATCNIQQCWELLPNNVASVCTGLKRLTKCKRKQQLPTLLAQQCSLVVIASVCT